MWFGHSQSSGALRKDRGLAGNFRRPGSEIISVESRVAGQRGGQIERQCNRAMIRHGHVDDTGIARVEVFTDEYMVD